MPDVDFAIVDPHIHQWEPRATPRAVSILARPLGRWPTFYKRAAELLMPKPARDFVGGDSVLFPYLPADYAADAAGLRVDTVVHVQAGWHDHSVLGPVGETRWLESLDFAGSGLTLGAIVAQADLCNPRVGETLAAHLQASAKVRGIRDMASRHPDRGVMQWTKRERLFQDKAFLLGFEQLAKHGLRFDAWCYSHQLPDVAALAQRFPEVSIVLDHLGSPVGAGGPSGGAGATEQERARIIGRWRDDLARLREHEQVFAKLSGLAMPVIGFGFHTRQAPPSIEQLSDAFRPFIAHALDVFGLERAFFASNFPMDKASAPLSHLFGAYERLARERDPHALRALFRDNARRFYGIT